ncbi:hypothetical protein H5410_051970 [Solanum commersonii]|uniref:Uncharacterized protein n=1 Tax=Solanum commersonii TaxID=4109 RepID=A0A9J5X0Z3_SOLCO|nr:hypothetical protein H5410_051970 [Solanum commersonii]
MSPQSQATMTNLIQATLDMHLTMQGQATLKRVSILNPNLPLGDHTKMQIQAIQGNVQLSFPSYHEIDLNQQSHPTLTRVLEYKCKISTGEYDSQPYAIVRRA